MCGNGSVRPVTEGAGGLGQVVARDLQQLLCNLDVVVRQRREAVGVVALLGERGLQVVRLQPLWQFDETLVALLEVRSHPERDLRASEIVAPEEGSCCAAASRSLAPRLAPVV